MHLKEDYDFLKDRLSDGTFTREMRLIAEKAGRPFNKEDVFKSPSQSADGLDLPF